MRNGEATRHEIERCALELFYQKGIAHTTIKDISHMANIADGTMYRHYQSKDGLAESIFLTAYKSLTKKIYSDVAQIDSLEDKLSYIIEYYCKKFDSNKILFGFLLKMQHKNSEHINNNPYSVYRLLVKIFSEQLPDDNIYKTQPEFAATLFIGIMLQAGNDRVCGRIKRTMMEDCDNLKCAAFRMLNLI